MLYKLFGLAVNTWNYNNPRAIKEFQNHFSFSELTKYRSLLSVSLQVNLGSHQYLFTVDVNPSEMPCLCLRHDVDALVWQPRPDKPSNMWEHIATFNALGKSQSQNAHFLFGILVPWWFKTQASVVLRLKMQPNQQHRIKICEAAWY